MFKTNKCLTSQSVCFKVSFPEIKCPFKSKAQFAKLSSVREWKLLKKYSEGKIILKSSLVSSDTGLARHLDTPQCTGRVQLSDVKRVLEENQSQPKKLTCLHENSV